MNGVKTHEPRAGRSVRPATLEPEQRAVILANESRATAVEAELRSRIETPLLVVVALVLAFLIKTFVVQAFYIPSGSMIPTLQIGDRVLVEKLSFLAREPRRGEVLVFRRPGAVDVDSGIAGAARSFLEGLGLVQPREDIDLIKRLMGLPGETVELRDGVLYVDGEPLREDYAQLDDRDFGPVTVPDGELFFLGDNRGNSDDSRYGLGTVPVDNIVGRAFVILWPPTHADVTLAEDPVTGEPAPPAPSPEATPSPTPSVAPLATEVPSTPPPSVAPPATPEPTLTAP